MCHQQSLRSAYAYAQSDQSICLSLEYSMSVKLLTEHLLEVLILKGGCTGSSEFTLVQMSNCWKSHAIARIYTYFDKSSLALASVIMPVCPVKYVRTNEPSSTLNNFTVLSLEAVSILVSSSAYSQLFTASL